MARDRIGVAMWTLGLGMTTGLVVSSVARPPAALSTIQFTLLLALASGLALAGLLWTRWEQWLVFGGWLGIAVYFSTLFVGSVVFGGVPGLAVADGPARTGVQLLGSTVAFATTVWVCFYGGAQVILDRVASRLDLDI